MGASAGTKVEESDCVCAVCVVDSRLKRTITGSKHARRSFEEYAGSGISWNLGYRGVKVV